MDKKQKLNFPVKVKHVIEKLNESGFEAFLVGGCVRDSILGRVPDDWDVTTNAFPEDIKEIFEKTYDTGIKHGTISVCIDNEFFEVTTYRKDGEYSDFRRPDNVEFTSSLRFDLARRDFTINSLAYHPNEGIVDYYNGLSDIATCQIKAVGDARVRFKEDALRMLRAIRFSAQLGFEIDEETYIAIMENSSLIKNISYERIRDEISKILISSNPMQFNLLHDTKLLKHIIPEFEICYSTIQNNPYHVYNVANHIMHAVNNVKNDSILRWTMLLHDIGKPVQKTTDEKGIDHFYGHQAVSADMAKVILSRLKFDNNFIKKVVNLIIHHDIDIFDTEKSVRRVVSKVGRDAFLDLLEVQTADAMSQNRIYLDNRLIKVDNIKRIFNNIKGENQCTSKSGLAINGHDLISIGMKPGIEMRQMLDYLLECVLEDPQLNDRQRLINIAKSRIL